ncbi:MAG: hypothetical protein ACFE7R_08060 [Candidatus Hodarchaeota archaeon]
MKKSRENITIVILISITILLLFIPITHEYISVIETKGVYNDSASFENPEEADTPIRLIFIANRTVEGRFVRSVPGSTTPIVLLAFNASAIDFWYDGPFILEVQFDGPTRISIIWFQNVTITENMVQWFIRQSLIGS